MPQLPRVPTGRGARRLLPLAIVAPRAGSAAVVPRLAVPALRGRRQRPRGGPGAEGRRRGRDRRPARAPRRGVELVLLPGARAAGRRRRRSQAGLVPAQAGHELRRRRSTRSPAAPHGHREAHDPGGPLAPRGGADRGRLAAGQLPEGEPALAPAEAEPLRGQAGTRPRGLPVPGHLRAQAPAAGLGARERAADGVQARVPEGQPALCEVEEPHRLRRAHDRLDGRARGAGGQGAAAGGVGDLQPPARGDAAPDRRDGPLRHRQLDAAAAALGAAHPEPLQHLHPPGPAPGPIGSPGLASIRAAARPARTSYLYYVVKPGTCGEHVFARTDAEFQRALKRYNRERARRGGKSPTNC